MHYVILDMIFACIYAWDPRMTCNRACIYTIYPKRKKIRFMLNEEGNNEENLFGIKLFFLKGVC